MYFPDDLAKCIHIMIPEGASCYDGQTHEHGKLAQEHRSTFEGFRYLSLGGELRVVRVAGPSFALKDVQLELDFGDLRSFLQHLTYPSPTYLKALLILANHLPEEHRTYIFESLKGYGVRGRVLSWGYSPIPRFWSELDLGPITTVISWAQTHSRNLPSHPHLRRLHVDKAGTQSITEDEELNAYYPPGPTPLYFQEV